MSSLKMSGPFGLLAQTIDKNVRDQSIGNYALGYMKGDKFIVKYVGRSDTNLNSRLHSWVGKGYKLFKYSYASSVKQAFEKECVNYHDFGGNQKLDNDIHPDRPSKKDWECPECTIFDIN